jgi:hypothetical protein
LGGISALQFVNLVGDSVVEETVAHVATDKINRCKTPDLIPIGLPERAVEGPPVMIVSFTLA